MAIATEWELKNLKGIIYKFINKINKKVYIGQTMKTFRERYHKNENWHKYVSNIHFRNSLLKYGFNNFKVEILEKNIINPILLDFLENLYIKEYASNNQSFGYNQLCGNVMPSRRFNTEKFIQKSLLQHPKKEYDYSLVEYINYTTNVKIICKKCDKVFIQTPYRHLSGRGCGNKFCWVPRRNKNLISKNVKKNSIRRYRKAVEQFDLNGVKIGEFKSLVDAEKQLSNNGIRCNRINIGDVCRGKQKSSAGFIWKFKYVN